jgi:DNA polymerase-3 subunit epsilon
VALWPELKRRLAGAAVVAHGAGTERRFLRAFPYHGFAPWIDTLKLARKSLPGLGEHSLGSVCDAAGLTASIEALCPGKGWHDALFDAVASVAFLEFLVEESGLQNHPLAVLAEV